VSGACLLMAWGPRLRISVLALGIICMLLFALHGHLLRVMPSNTAQVFVEAPKFEMSPRNGNATAIRNDAAVRRAQSRGTPPVKEKWAVVQMYDTRDDGEEFAAAILSTNQVSIGVKL
jgi:hypothetical protein